MQRKSIVSAFVVFVAQALFTWAAATAQAQAVTQFDLPSQPLADSIKAVASQTNTNLLFDPVLVAGWRAPALNAQLTPDQAITQLVSSAGLRVQALNEKTIVLAVAQSSAISPQGGTPPTTDAPLHKEVASGENQTGAATRGFWSQFRLAQLGAQVGASAGTSSSSNELTTSGMKLEEVVVTAQKREEKLKDVPIAISVLDGRNLDTSPGEGIADALASVPGVSLVNDLWNGSQITVRGVAATSPVLAGSSPTAYYIDSVPFSFVRNAIEPDVNAYDLQRVEVLRGPQGTLYGASALNGVVRILTNDATPDEFDIKGRASVYNTKGGQESYRGDVAVNVPIVADKLAARAAVSYANLGGWIDKLNKKDANDTESSNIRLKVNARPTDNLSTTLTLWRSRTDRGALSVSDENDSYPGSFDTPTSLDYDVFGLKIAYEFAAFSATSTTSYIDLKNKVDLDFTPEGLTPLLNRMGAKGFAEELLLSSTSTGLW